MSWAESNWIFEKIQGLKNKEEFITVSGNFIVPTNGIYVIECIGAGGTGLTGLRGTPAASCGAGGAGGGSGGYSKSRVRLQKDSVIPITVDLSYTAFGDICKAMAASGQSGGVLTGAVGNLVKVAGLNGSSGGPGKGAGATAYGGNGANIPVTINNLMCSGGGGAGDTQSGAGGKGGQGYFHTDYRTVKEAFLPTAGNKAGDGFGSPGQPGSIGGGGGAGGSAAYAAGAGGKGIYWQVLPAGIFAGAAGGAASANMSAGAGGGGAGGYGAGGGGGGGAYYTTYGGYGAAGGPGIIIVSYQGY